MLWQNAKEAGVEFAVTWNESKTLWKDIVPCKVDIGTHFTFTTEVRTMFFRAQGGPRSIILIITYRLCGGQLI